MADWNAQATWDALYSVRIRDPNHAQYGQKVGYSRLGMARFKNPYTDSLDLYIDRAQALVDRNFLTPNQDVLVVGCGFGFLLEVILDAGGDPYGLDSSTYIQTNAALHVPVGVAARIVTGNILDTATNLLNLLKPLVGGNGRSSVVITECVLETIDPADYTTFFNNCESLATNNGTIIHLVVCNINSSPTPQDFIDFDMQWRSLSEWASFASSDHIFVCAQDWSNVTGTL